MKIDKKELRKLALRKGWHAQYQQCPGTWVIFRQADKREGINPWGESLETIARFLLTQPDEKITE